MRYIRYFLTIILLLILITNGGIEVLAMDTGFSTESLPEADIDTFLKNVNISVLIDEPPKAAIKCFDVNENGAIAIGCSDFEQKTIRIYTGDGVFQYGYSFESYGDFGIEFNGDILIIYFVRSDVALSINPSGEVESIVKIQNTIENNSYWHKSVFSTKRKSGDSDYIIKNDMGVFNIFCSSYSQLITINSNGEESIIYDVNSAQFTNMVLTFVGVLMIVCIAIAVIIRQLIKLNCNT